MVKGFFDELPLTHSTPRGFFDQLPLTSPMSTEDMAREHEAWERDVAPWVDAIAGPALASARSRKADKIELHTGEQDD